MNRIYKCISGSPVDYAAEELKKYLRMLMPQAEEIDIFYDPAAIKEGAKGFRLGLMQDFGLDVSDAMDPELDDILYIEADAEGGIIAGDNLRSVLLAVYEYLRQQGCRWLFPELLSHSDFSVCLSGMIGRQSVSIRWKIPSGCWR